MASETDITRYLILDRGAFEVGLPADWEVQRQPDREIGAIIVKDAADSIQLDVACWPTGLPEHQTVEGFLMAVMADGGLSSFAVPRRGRGGTCATPGSRMFTRPPTTIEAERCGRLTVVGACAPTAASRDRCATSIGTTTPPGRCEPGRPSSRPPNWDLESRSPHRSTTGR